jgi:hypothetical protein
MNSLLNYRTLLIFIYTGQQSPPKIMNSLQKSKGVNSPHPTNQEGENKNRIDEINEILINEILTRNKEKQKDYPVKNYLLEHS